MFFCSLRLVFSLCERDQSLSSAESLVAVLIDLQRMEVTESVKKEETGR